MSELVKLNTHGDVAVITIDNPPVNALSSGVPEGISAALEAIERNTAVQAAVFIGAGRTWVAGADIRQLELAAGGNAPEALELHPLLKRIEDFPKPIVM